ncbi:NAD(P)-dependent oxidoreductase [Microbacterium sp.]|uniref:NAD(P)-dependent oxidoreductase n=1 Tax=Microbacterium sp. TaxID=51671 RepID=UPI003C1802EC
MTESATPRVGYIGLGDMGGPIALHLAESDLDTVVFDLRAEAMEPHVAAGARAASSLEDLVGSVDVIGICVLYDHQVEAILLEGPGSVLAHSHPGQVILINSTCLPETVEKVTEAAEKKSVKVFDAPVSGASFASRQGTLTVFAGGPDETLDYCRPILDTYSSKIVHVGPAPGDGQAGKLANNLMFHVNHTAVMEAIRLGEAFGLTKEKVLEVAAAGSGNSWAATNYDHWDRFGVEHTLAGTDEIAHRLSKDLRYAVAEGLKRQTYLPVSAVASQVQPDMMTARWARNAAEQAASEE